MEQACSKLDSTWCLSMRLHRVPRSQHASPPSSSLQNSKITSCDLGVLWHTALGKWTGRSEVLRLDRPYLVQTLFIPCSDLVQTLFTSSSHMCTHRVRSLPTPCSHLAHTLFGHIVFSLPHSSLHSTGEPTAGESRTLSLTATSQLTKACTITYMPVLAQD